MTRVRSLRAFVMSRFRLWEPNHSDAGAELGAVPQRLEGQKAGADETLAPIDQPGLA
jgi:hypothetical protein